SLDDRSGVVGEVHALEYIARQVLVLNDFGEALPDVGSVDPNGFIGHLRSAKGHIIQEPLENGVQSPRTDVLRPAVHQLRRSGNLHNRLVVELETDSLSCQERGVLPNQRVLWLAQNPYQVLAGKCLELHPNGESALQLGNQIRWLGDVE